MRQLFLVLLFFSGFLATAQIFETKVLDTIEKDSLPPVYDVKYREDQFYASLTYNLIQSKPDNYSQDGVSTGISLGFLRDMPVNKNRTYAVALGLGYSYSNLKHNLQVLNVDGTNTYQMVSNGSFDKNKLVLHYLEIPLELRWRNSNPTDHQFWRIYLGFKASWMFADKAIFRGDVNSTVKHDANLNDFVYGTYISAGWNTWNFYAYYGLTPVYNSAPIEGTDQKLKLRAINLGLMFYIL